MDEIDLGTKTINIFEETHLKSWERMIMKSHEPKTNGEN